MNRIELKFRIKSFQIATACRIHNHCSSIWFWFDQHFPEGISDFVNRITWMIESLTDRLFIHAYAGSWEEISDAWQHYDQDWLSPFQRMVADERILPLPGDKLT